MTGHQYRDLIASYIHHNYAAAGLVVYVEISLGKTVIGKDRAIDVFVVRPDDRKAIESLLNRRHPLLRGSRHEGDAA